MNNKWKSPVFIGSFLKDYISGYRPRIDDYHWETLTDGNFFLTIKSQGKTQSIHITQDEILTGSVADTYELVVDKLNYLHRLITTNGLVVGKAGKWRKFGKASSAT